MTYQLSSVNFTDQNDIIPEFGSEPLVNIGSAYSLAGNDQITGIGDFNLSTGLHNYYNATIDTGNGRDVITGQAWNPYYGYGIYNGGSIETGNDEDSIYSYGVFENYGMVSLGDGDDKLEAIASNNPAINNQGFINTGNGKDSIIADGGVYGGFTGNGNVFLGDGEDYLKGFGSGYYEGGNDQDSLELTEGSYTIITSGANVSFIRSGDGANMQTFGFEKLIANTTPYNSTTYDFTSLTDGQTILVY